MKTILSLFDHTHNWGRPFEKKYNVHYHDIKDGLDILENFPGPGFWSDIFGEVHGILASPPCTCFCGSGAWDWPLKDEGKKRMKEPCDCCESFTEHSILLVSAVLWLVELWNPKFWVIENPVGRLSKLMPELGEPRLRFQPHEYGDPYSKKTCLWGKFNIPVKQPVLNLFGSITRDSMGSACEDKHGKRSITPNGFAYAFYQANN
jgi:hypothetical protein